VANLKDQFDVIIIGAGPAGSTAARRCAEQGLETIIIEKQKIPRPKPCGGGVSLKALKLIGTKIPDDIIECYVKGFRFFSESLDSVDFLSNNPVGISTTRDKFDAFLTDLALDQGCKLIQTDRVVDISVCNKKVKCRLQSNRLIEGHMVVGADGAYSVTAQKAGLRNQWTKEEVGLCLESTVSLNEKEMKNLDSDIFEMYFINIPLGYGWLFPKKSSVSLGIGGCLANIRQPKEILMDLCEVVSKLKKIDLKISKFNAHLAPAGGFHRKIVSDHVMLVGDAAGFIDPLTGEGIYYAMKSGLLAATACTKAIEEGETGTHFLEKHYSKVCEKEFEKDLRVALGLTYKVHEHFNAFFNLLKSNSGSSWVELACGDVNYRILRRKLLPRLLFGFVSHKFQTLMRTKMER
jgi:geranylgeranyl reductase family protein